MQDGKPLLNNTNSDDYVKMLSQEAAKEIIKARVSGKVFRMADFDKIQADPTAYETEVQRWKVAIKKALKTDTVGIGKKHLFAWGIEDDLPDDKYADLPENGVPSTKDELLALMKMGRLGAKYLRSKHKASTADAGFDEVVQHLSGGLYDYASYMDEKTNAKIAEAVELVRLTLSAGLNNEMENPFMKGQFANYKAVMEWIDEKTQCTRKTEYMNDIFSAIDEAFDGDMQVDARCMAFRMALEMLYITKPVETEPFEFKDWEHNDAKAVIFEDEAYTPSLSFMFIWKIRNMLGKKVWLEIEEEFKREIGAEKYNKEGWMQNKPALYKIIKKYQKKNGKASVNSVETSKNVDNSDSDDDIELVMDDGSVLKVQPRFKGAGSTWKQNFTKKFNLQQSGNNRWQPRRHQQQSHQQQRSFNNNRNSGRNENYNKNNNGNNVDQQKSGPSADAKWKCGKCRDEGYTRSLRGDQKCPKHKWRPSYFKNVPCVNEVKVEGNDEDTDVDNKNGHLSAIKSCLQATEFSLYNESD